MYKDMEFHDSILRVNTLLKAKDVAEILEISHAMAYNLMQR
jgi:predicted transcriptional regulator